MSTLEWMLLCTLVIGVVFAVWVPKTEGSPTLFRLMSAALATSSAIVLGMHLMV